MMLEVGRKGILTSPRSFCWMYSASWLIVYVVMVGTNFRGVFGMCFGPSAIKLSTCTYLSKRGEEAPVEHQHFILSDISSK